MAKEKKEKIENETVENVESSAEQSTESENTVVEQTEVLEPETVKVEKVEESPPAELSLTKAQLAYYLENDLKKYRNISDVTQTINDVDGNLEMVAPGADTLKTHNPHFDNFVLVS